MVVYSLNKTLRWSAIIFCALFAAQSAGKGAETPDYAAMNEMNLVIEKVYTNWHPPIKRDAQAPVLLVSISGDGKLSSVKLAYPADCGFVDLKKHMHKGSPTSGSPEFNDMLIQAVRKATPFPLFKNGRVKHEPYT